MAEVFGATSTADQVLEGLDLRGKRILVTGVSAGLGIETARALVARGGHIVGAARNLAKARHACARIAAVAEAAGGTFELTEFDLGSLASVRNCTDRLLAEGQPIDVIIGNAGVMATPFSRTQDGYETQFGTNHLGHFVLINRLVPLLKPGSRVICLASSGHRFADVDLVDPNFENTPYNDFVAYGRSKTANVLFAVGFDRRHRKKGIRAAAVHPGRIATELSRHMSRERLSGFSIPETPAAALALGFKSIAQGAATSVWAAVVAPAGEVGGRYCEDCQVAEIRADPEASDGVAPYAIAAERARMLWAVSERMTGETY